MASFSLHMTKTRRFLLFAVLSLAAFASYFGLNHAANYKAALRANCNPAAKFAIIVMTTKETTYDYISFSNKHKYATKHGYDLIWDFEPSRHYTKVWDKLNLTRDAILSTMSGTKAYEWIWMLDFDTLITNSSILIPDVIEQSLLLAESEGKRREDINLVLTRDCEPLNAGSMFFRTSAWTLDFIEQWRANAAVKDDQGRLRNEQDVLRDMLHDNDYSIVDKSVIAPQWMFDAYPEELSECLDPRSSQPWEPGMFLLHFAGASWWLKEREKDPVGRLMRKYSLQVE